ncbi:MAG: hypothetical protein IKU07_06600 [Oscillospiraceae bacterium]|nr:hypothetical protein [Oscillospiraceae bacterium]
MKKILALLFVCMLCLSACASSGGAEQQETTAATTEPIQTTEAAALTDAEIYDAFLGKLCEKLLAIIGDDTHLDGFAEREGMLGVNEIVQRLERDMLDKIGYVVTDINSDGVLELMICAVDSLEGESCTGTRILCAFTVADNDKVLLLEGTSANRYYLLDDMTVYNETGESNAAVGRGVYSLGSESAALTCKDFYFTYPDENNTILFYHNVTGTFDTAASEAFDGDETAFSAVLKAYADRIATMN